MHGKSPSGLSLCLFYQEILSNLKPEPVKGSLAVWNKFCAEDGAGSY
jgi:hypothetical protein